MRVALVTTFAASRKEPLLTMMDRVHQGFVDAGLAEPTIHFNFGDPQIGGVSSVDRVLKRHPELERFVTTADPMPNIPGTRRISNGPMSAGAGENVPYATLQAIAAGVPRSFPFHSIALHFYSPEFGEPVPATAARPVGGMMVGIRLTDSWWVNGRNRSLSACTVVEAETSSKKLPPYPPPVATVLAACGKARKTVQAPLAATLEAGPVPAVRIPTGALIASADPEKAKLVHEVVLRYRQQMPEIVERAGLPHDLPDPQEARQRFGPQISSGPKKPALEHVFKPMGYSCRGEAGDFVLRRRAASNLSVYVSIAIGSWGKSVTAHYSVWGLGFKAVLSLPPAARAGPHGQYATGDAEQWQKIAENLGALVAELDQSFVPEIESVAGPSPEWYRPES
jgi:hypothetical protein